MTAFGRHACRRLESCRWDRLNKFPFVLQLFPFCSAKWNKCPHINKLCAIKSIMDFPIFKYKINLMKKIASSILLALPFLVFAQQKDYIVTLQEDEYFSSDNSQLLGTSTGYEWKCQGAGYYQN